MIVCPTNKLVVKFKHKYISNVSDLLKRSAIQNGSTVDPIDVVNIVGEVVSLPKVVTKRLGLENFSLEGIDIGDNIIVSHKVIYDMVMKADTPEPVYKNMITYNGEEYFVCDISLVYGVIKNDDIIMLNGFVMLRPFQEAKIILAAASKKTKGTVKCQVMYIGNPKKSIKPIDAKQGDWAYFNPMVGLKYQINNKPFVIVSQHHILGIEATV